MKRSYPPAYYYLRLLAIVFVGWMISRVYVPFVALFDPIVDGREMMDERQLWLGYHLFSLVFFVISVLLAQIFHVDDMINRRRPVLDGRWRLAAAGLGMMFVVIHVAPHILPGFIRINPLGCIGIGIDAGSELTIFSYLFLPLPFLWDHVIQWGERPAAAVVDQAL